MSRKITHVSDKQQANGLKFFNPAPATSLLRFTQFVHCSENSLFFGG